MQSGRSEESRFVVAEMCDIQHERDSSAPAGPQNDMSVLPQSDINRFRKDFSRAV